MVLRRLVLSIFCLSLLSVLSACSVFTIPKAQEKREWEVSVERMVLDNGMRVLLVRRNGPPIFSGYVRFKVGNLEEPEGYSGLAHFFEHMAFKGTPTIGVEDFGAEEKLLEKIHFLGTKLTKERNTLSKAESAQLRTEFNDLQEAHQKLIVKNEFTRIYARNGSADMNATTSSDFTSYYTSLPSNKLELWAFLESERIKRPVLREFFKERDVVGEERRMRYDNSPEGQLFEAFMNRSFDKGPYKTLSIGSSEEIASYTPDVALEFRSKYYVPSRMVVAIVGNFNVDEAKTYIREYFGDLKDYRNQDYPYIDEPLAEDFPRQVTISGKDRARFYLGYHRPAYPHPDDKVFDVIHSLFCDGRTSYLYKTLVTDEKIAASVSCYSSLPGARLPGLFSFYAVPFAGHSNQEVEQRLIEILQAYQNRDVTDQDIQKVANRIEVDTLRELRGNMGLAGLLSYYEILSGDWQYIYQVINDVKGVDAEDIKRVIQKYFVPARQVSAYYETHVE